MKCRSVCFVAMLIIWLGAGSVVEATMANQKSIKKAYPDQKVSCQLCHDGRIGKRDDLNAYGLALQELKAPGSSKALSEEDYEAIAGQDADGDGYSNGLEIVSGTNPSDVESIPEGVEQDVDLSQEDEVLHEHEHDLSISEEK